MYDNMSPIENAHQELHRAFGERYSSDLVERRRCANRETWLAPQPADAVVWPSSEKDVVDIVNICRRASLPMIPYGAGTSLEGQTNAPQGGVAVRFDHMNRILAIDPDDMLATVQPGATREDLDAAAKAMNLFYPVDPSLGATFGGMASTRASGTNAVRYGTAADNVVSMRVVLADGTVASTGSKARKSASGYDMTKLFIGAEGTLGIITELTVRLWPIEQSMVAGRCAFPTLMAACDAVIALQRTGIRPDKMEIIDELGVSACNSYFGFAYPVAPTLFFQFSGPETVCAAAIDVFKAKAELFGGVGFESGGTADERERLWTARKNAWWAFRALDPQAIPVSTDVCVPQSKLAACIEAAKVEITKANIVAPIIGHVGDGNFHALVLVRMQDHDAVEAAKRFVDKLGELAISVGGTCSGEHGIGQGKQALFALERGQILPAMRAVKAALDPQNIFNPGKFWVQ